MCGRHADVSIVGAALTLKLGNGVDHHIGPKEYQAC